MTWGSFGLVHILSLVAAALMVAALYFILKNRTRKVQTLVLGVLSFSGIAAIIYNLVLWGTPWQYLPLQLCSINALLLPFAVFTRNKTVCNLLLVWSLGALAALVLNTEMAEATLLDHPFCFYYFPHVLEFGIPILLFVLGHAKKDPKCILPTVGITMGVYTAVHFINLGLNKWYQAADIRTPDGEIVFANFMYSLEPNNPLCELFQKWIPGPYWFMYLAVPILVVYLSIVYLPQILRKKNKAAA